MTEPTYPVDLSADAAHAACSAYGHALVHLEGHELNDPGYRLADPATHVEAHAVRAALPYALRDELARLLDAAFPDDDVDYHYGLEELREGVQRRHAELDRYLELSADRRADVEGRTT